MPCRRAPIMSTGMDPPTARSLHSPLTPPCSTKLQVPLLLAFIILFSASCLQAALTNSRVLQGSLALKSKVEDTCTCECPGRRLKFPGARTGNCWSFCLRCVCHCATGCSFLCRRRCECPVSGYSLCGAHAQGGVCGCGRAGVLCPVSEAGHPRRPHDAD